MERLQTQALHQLAVRALQSYGLAAGDAQLTAEILVMADRFGLHTHGVSRVQSYGERLLLGGINPNAKIRIERKSPGLATVDGDNGVGPLVGRRALQTAMELARDCGVAAVFARGSNHFGPISPYAYLAAKQGFASFICSNATTTIAPWGGSEARLGNNPLGFGIPNGDGPPFLLDLALSVAARAKIRKALQEGRDIPSTWATDAQGRPTTDPQAALSGFLLAIGGHKGYGLALAVDLLAGLLSGAAYLTHVKSWVDEPEQAQNLGHCFVLIDTAKLGDLRWLGERMADFRHILHDTPASDATQPVLVPGEIELTRWQESETLGVAIEPASLAHLQERAGLLADTET